MVRLMSDAGIRPQTTQIRSGDEALHRITGAQTPSGIPVVMDDYSWSRLAGAVLRVDADPAGEGFRLDHPDAVLTTFC